MIQIQSTPERQGRPAFLFVLITICMNVTTGCISMSESSTRSEQRQTTVKSDIVIPTDCKSNVTNLPDPDTFNPVQIEPEIIYQPPLEYPKMAKTAGLQGKVLMQAYVCENGEVIDVRVGKSSGVASLDESAVNQARATKYRPAIQDGYAVRLWVSYTVEFKLD